MTPIERWETLVAAAHDPESAGEMLAEQLEQEKDHAASTDQLRKVLTDALDITRELAYAEPDRSEEAFIALSAAISVFDSVVDPEIAADIYKSRVRAALLLEALARHDQALNLLRQLVSEQGDLGSSLPMDCAWFYAHFCLCQLNYLESEDEEQQILFKIGLIDDLVNRFGLLKDGEIQQGLGELLHNKVNMLLYLGEEPEASSCLSQIYELCQLSDDSRARFWAHMSQVRLDLLHVIPPPVPIVLDEVGDAVEQGANPDDVVSAPWLEMERRHALSQAERDKREVRVGPLRGTVRAIVCLLRFRRLVTSRRLVGEIERHLREMLDIYDTTVEKAREAHLAAVTVTQSFRYWGDPFVLYLRNFEAEQQFGFTGTSDNMDTAGTLPNTYYGFTNVFGEPSDRLTDSSLILGLQQAFRVLTATNPYGQLDWRLPGPRILMPDAAWRHRISELMRSAEFIVFRIVVLSPGVQDELSLIRSSGAAGKTIVVLARPDEQEDVLGFLSYLHEVYNLSRPEAEQISIDSPLLSDLSVVYDDDVYNSETQTGPLVTPADHFAEVQNMDVMDRFAYLAGRLGLGGTAHRPS